MLRLLIPVLAALVCVAPVRAQSAPSPNAADAAPASDSAPAAASASEDDNAEPTVVDRRIVAIASAGVAVLALAGGVTFGMLAQQDLACLKDVVACNATRADPIVGLELFDQKAELEQKAVFADMFFVTAASAAIVATVSGLQGFVFAEEPVAPPAVDAPSPTAAAAAPEPVPAAAPEPPSDAAPSTTEAPAADPAPSATPETPAPATDGATPPESAP